jgi:hypothetical protein
MPDSHCRVAASILLAWLIDINRIPALRPEGASEWLTWLTRTIQIETSLPLADIIEAGHGLAAGLPLDGSVPLPQRPVWDVALGLPQRDLTHVLVQLRELDDRGVTARLVSQLRQGWPLFAEAVEAAEATTVSDGGTAGDAAVEEEFSVEVMPAAAQDDGDKPESSLDALTAYPVRVMNQVLDVRIIGEVRSPAPEDSRLRFDDAALTVAIDDGSPIYVANPRAFKVFKTIAEASPNVINRKDIQVAVCGTKGDRTIRDLIDKLPQRLREAVKSDTTGYWLCLPTADSPPVEETSAEKKRSKRRPRGR